MTRFHSASIGAPLTAASAALLAVLSAVACAAPAASAPRAEEMTAAPQSAPAPGPRPAAAASAPDQPALVSALVKQHGDAARARVERGVRQVASFWRAEDGDAAALQAFVASSFVADEGKLPALLQRFSLATEQLDGHFLEMGRALRSWSELELGPQLDVDALFAALDPSAHLPEDLFASKLAFVALLNFPLPELEEMVAQGPSWTRAQWAAARLTRRFALRPSGARARLTLTVDFPTPPLPLPTAMI